MLEFKFDTQLLIEGEHLSEDAIHDYVTENIEGDSSVSRRRRRIDQNSLSIPIRHGRCWNIVPAWARFMISSLKTWNVSLRGCRVNRGRLRP